MPIFTICIRCFDAPRQVSSLDCGEKLSSLELGENFLVSDETKTHASRRLEKGTSFSSLRLGAQRLATSLIAIWMNWQTRCRVCSLASGHATPGQQHPGCWSTRAKSRHPYSQLHAPTRERMGFTSDIAPFKRSQCLVYMQ